MHFYMPNAVLAVAGSRIVSPSAVYDKYAYVIIMATMPWGNSCRYSASPLLTMEFVDSSVVSVLMSILVFGAYLCSYHSRQLVCSLIFVLAYLCDGLSRQAIS